MGKDNFNAKLEGKNLVTRSFNLIPWWYKNLLQQTFHCYTRYSTSFQGYKHNKKHRMFILNTVFLAQIPTRTSLFSFVLYMQYTSQHIFWWFSGWYLQILCTPEQINHKLICWKRIINCYTLNSPAAMCSVALTAMPIWTPLETTSPRCCLLIRTTNHFKTCCLIGLKLFFC